MYFRHERERDGFRRVGIDIQADGTAQPFTQVDGVDTVCVVDEFRCEQVFRNLFENSLSACQDPVQIEVVCRDTQITGRPALQVSVRDNGPGLSAEQQSRVFEAFYTTNTKGTGLGMSIVQRIVEAHGGQIAVENGSRVGAEFLITLPRDNR